MLLVIDNYDSFTYNLCDYFAQLGEDICLIKNDEADGVEVSRMKFDRLVISPGPNTPRESGHLMSIIQSMHQKVPILGICLGHQALGEFFGAKLVHAEQPMHGKVSELFHDGNGLFEGLPQQFNVCRYHSLLLKDVESTQLETTAWTDQKECMGFKHQQLPISGIQFHPEAILTEHGLSILKNWIRQTSPSSASGS